MKTWDANMESMICKIDKFQFVGIMIKARADEINRQPSKFASEVNKEKALC